MLAVGGRGGTGWVGRDRVRVRRRAANGNPTAARCPGLMSTKTTAGRQCGTQALGLPSHTKRVHTWRCSFGLPHAELPTGAGDPCAWGRTAGGGGVWKQALHVCTRARQQWRAAQPEKEDRQAARWPPSLHPSTQPPHRWTAAIDHAAGPVLGSSATAAQRGRPQG